MEVSQFLWKNIDTSSTSNSNAKGVNADLLFQFIQYSKSRENLTLSLKKLEDKYLKYIPKALWKKIYPDLILTHTVSHKFVYAARGAQCT